MRALKMIVRPNEHRKVVIELPADFQAEEVEVIVVA